MRLLIFFGVLALVATSLADTNDKEWEDFKANNKKSFADSKQENTRKQIFIANIKDIEQHNAKYAKGEVSYEKGINKFSDLTYEEFSKKYTGAVHAVSNKKVPGGRQIDLLKGEARQLAPLVDLRNTGNVGPIKNQGNCGSCWAFSAVAALEGAYFKKNRKSIVLSEQNLVDCAGPAYGNYGCNGGWPFAAFNYVINNRGISTSASYPYTALTQSCKYNPNTIGTSQVGYVYHRSYGYTVGSESWLQDRVANIGVISVAIWVNSNFQAYKNGVYRDTTCNRGSVNHAVNVVGYGTDAVQGAYWIVRNSWGSSWGSSGYILMARNNGNQCYISSFSIYPTI